MGNSSTTDLKLDSLLGGDSLPLNPPFFLNRELDQSRLFKKLAKRIRECQLKGITNIYIHFDQNKRQYADNNQGDTRVYYSKQRVDLSTLVEFISLYSSDEVSMTLHRYPVLNNYLHINLNPVAAANATQTIQPRSRLARIREPNRQRGHRQTVDDDCTATMESHPIKALAGS